MKKLHVFLLSVSIFLIAGDAFGQLIIVQMKNARICTYPPVVNSSGGGSTLPLTWVEVTWESNHYAGPLDLYCNGQLVASDVYPYKTVPYYSPLYGWLIYCYYKKYDAVAGFGTFTYQSEYAVNTVSVTIP